MTRTLIALCILLIAGCTSIKKTDTVSKPVINKTSFSALPNWQNDQHEAALNAFKFSCQRILKKDPNQAFSNDIYAGKYADWQAPCQIAMAATMPAKTFFETYFAPYSIKDSLEKDGLFTGYYEPTLRGSRVQSGAYQTPIYERPTDLIMVNLGDFRDELKGQRIAGRVIEGSLKPYESHAEINAQKLQNAKIMAWVDSPIDAFFLQIQGSGRIVFEDGSFIRAGYAAQNGHAYYAIGKALIDRGALDKENVSLQTIKAWLRNNPAEARNLMEKNPSFVFFRELETQGVVGGEGVVLTPERSLAIDSSRYPYGMPIFVNIQHPTTTENPIQRLMVGQDTGGAIRGVVRGDFFWGPGQHAENLAGVMKSKGEYWFLLPKSISSPKS